MFLGDVSGEGRFCRLLRSRLWASEKPLFGVVQGFVRPPWSSVSGSTWLVYEGSPERGEGICAARALASLSQALRDSNVRATNFGREPRKQEFVERRRAAAVFLASCLLEADDDEAKTKLPKKLERLSSYYLLHACDWQLQGQGLPGYSWYFPCFGPQLAPESRPLLIENMDSGSQNMCKTFYLLSQKKARVLPVWDAFHKRWNMAQAAHKATGLWMSIKLNSITFEINRGPFKGFAFFVQQLEAMRGFLDMVSEGDPLFEEFLPRICADQVLDPASVGAGAILDGLREAKWLHKLGPRTAPSRWFSWHAAQECFEPHNTERLAGMCFLGIQQG